MTIDIYLKYDDGEEGEDEAVQSGQWVIYLCDSVNKMGKGTEERKMTLSFTLGCILHYCGDLFGHDFVNTFAGGSFPTLLDPEIINIKGEKLNNVLSHGKRSTFLSQIVCGILR